MKIAFREKNDIPILDISGKLTMSDGSEKLREMIDGLLANEKKNIVINLSEMEYIDSTGVGEMVASLKTVENLGGQMKLVNLRNQAYKTLSLALLLPVFDIYETEDEALSKFE